MNSNENLKIIKHHSKIQNLGIIGNQRTVALIDKNGAVVWYCPDRFDSPSVFAALLDLKKGGIFSVQLDHYQFKTRYYIKHSGILTTEFEKNGADIILQDWMPYFEDAPSGICRRVLNAKDTVSFTLDPAPDYGRQEKQFKDDKDHWQINEDIFVYSSHHIKLENNKLVISIPEDQEGWIFLSDKKIDRPKDKEIEKWYQQTIDTWEEIASHVNYNGIYGKEISESIRAIRLLTDRTSWGIIAAATTSL